METTSLAAAAKQDLEFFSQSIGLALHRVQHWLSYLQTLYARDNGMNQVGFKGMLLSQFAEIEADGWKIFTDQEIVHNQAATPEYLDVVLQKGSVNIILKLKYWRVWYCRFQNARYSLSEQYQQYNRRYRTPSSKRKWWRRHLERLKTASEQEVRGMDRHDMGRFNPLDREIAIAQDKVRRCMAALSQQYPKSYMVGLVIVGVGNRAVHEWVNLQETQDLIYNGIIPGSGVLAVTLPPAAVVDAQQQLQVAAGAQLLQQQQPHPQSQHPQHAHLYQQQQQQQHPQQQQKMMQSMQVLHPHHTQHLQQQLLSTGAAQPPVYILPHPQMVHQQVFHQPQQQHQHHHHQQQQARLMQQQQQQQLPPPLQVGAQQPMRAVYAHNPHQQLQRRLNESDDENLDQDPDDVDQEE